MSPCALDAAGCADVFMEDAVHLVPGREPVSGRNAIEAATARGIAGRLRLGRLAAFQAKAFLGS